METLFALVYGFTPTKGSNSTLKQIYCRVKDWIMCAAILLTGLSITMTQSRMADSLGGITSLFDDTVPRFSHQIRRGYIIVLACCLVISKLVSQQLAVRQPVRRNMTHFLGVLTAMLQTDCDLPVTWLVKQCHLLCLFYSVMTQITFNIVDYHQYSTFFSNDRYQYVYFVVRFYCVLVHTVGICVILHTMLSGIIIVCLLASHFGNVCRVAFNQLLHSHQ